MENQAPRFRPTFSLKTVLWHLTIWLALLGFRLTIDYPSERDPRLPGEDNLEILGKVVALALLMEVLRAFFPTARKLAIALVVVVLLIPNVCALVLALLFWDADAGMFAMIPLMILKSDYMLLEWPLLIFLLTRRIKGGSPEERSE